MYMDKTQNLTIKILDKFNDVINLNAFIATRLERARFVYKTSRLTGLWQLDLLDLEGERLWTVGHYVNGTEDNVVEYDVTARLHWHGYVIEESGKDLPHVLWTRGGFIFVTLPHEHRKDVIVVAPHVCRRTDPLLEPVYIWRNAEGRYGVLDCGGGLETFTRKQFEKWVWSMVRENDTIHWPEWYVVGTVSSNEKWLTVVMQAVCGSAYPTPEEVFTLVDELLHP
jgi:hypothetical protein